MVTITVQTTGSRSDDIGHARVITISTVNVAVKKGKQMVVRSTKYKRPHPLKVPSLAVDLAAVSDAKHQDEQNFILNVANDAIISHPVFP